MIFHSQLFHHALLKLYLYTSAQDNVICTSQLVQSFDKIISQIGALLSTLNSIFPVSKLPSSSEILISHRHVHSDPSIASTDRIQLFSSQSTKSHKSISHIKDVSQQAHSLACNNVIIFHISLVHDTISHVTYGETNVTPVFKNSYIATFSAVLSP
jgi:hypothetical protein